MKLAADIPVHHLRNGVHMPTLGFGTYQLRGDAAYEPVKTALRLGYRHVDTAAIYKNEEAVGRGIKDSGVPRENIFLTSKLFKTDQGYEQAKAAFAASLQRLGTDYLDLYLIHWPGVEDIPGDSPENVHRRRASWKAIEELHKAGKIRAIGVSNFTKEQIQDLKAHSTIVPMVNQIEYHPRLQSEVLHEYMKTENIVLEAYQSLGQGRLIGHATVTAVAGEVGKSTSQVLLRWAIQKGAVIIPKSSHEDRIKENMGVFGWALSAAQMGKIDEMNDRHRYDWNPETIIASI